MSEFNNSENLIPGAGQIDVCQHGNIPGSCPQCWQEKKEKQPAYSQVEKLVAESKANGFIRSTTETSNCEVEIFGKKYTIETITSGEDSELSKVQSLFEKTFDPAEVDPEEALRNAVDGNTSWGTKDICTYRVTAIKNQQGEVISVCAGGLLDLKDEAGQNTGDTVFMVGYSASDYNKAPLGAGREAYISTLIDAIKVAEEQGKKLNYVAGETTSATEKFWNNIGFKRVYGRSKDDPKVLSEIKYIQPALDFNADTGLPDEDAGEVPEHLMMQKFSIGELTQEQVQQMVDAFYRWCVIMPREAYNNDEAYQENVRYAQEYLDKLQEHLAGSSELVLMDYKERSKTKKQGLNVRDYTEADKGEDNIMPESDELETETAKDKNDRFARGEITEAEIKEALVNPAKPLFTTEVVAKDKKGVEHSRIKITCSPISQEKIPALMKELKDVWDETSLKDMEQTMERFLEQKKSGEQSLLNVEYYIATDKQGIPLAITGHYTTDVFGGAGFATKEQLPAESHNLNVGLGWFAVSRAGWGKGIGEFMFDWTVNLAKSRGADNMFIETDDYINEAMALNMYKKKGFELGFEAKDYYGPGRDLATYYSNIAEDNTVKPLEIKENITQDNAKEILEIAERTFSPERLQEFRVVLGLLFKQTADKQIYMPQSFVLRTAEGKMESFCMNVEGIYANSQFNAWYGYNPEINGAGANLIAAMKGTAKQENKDIIVIMREGADDKLLEQGFAKPDDGIRSVYKKNDDTKFIFLTKKL